MAISGPYGSQKKARPIVSVQVKPLGAKIPPNLSECWKPLITSNSHSSPALLWSNLGGTQNLSTRFYPSMNPIGKRRNRGKCGEVAEILKLRVIKIPPTAVHRDRGNPNAAGGRAYG